MPPNPLKNDQSLVYKMGSTSVLLRGAYVFFLLWMLCACSNKLATQVASDGDEQESPEKVELELPDQEFDIEEITEDQDIQEDGDLELDDDLTIDPDPDWDRGFEAEPAEPEDPNPPMIYEQRHIINGLEPSESISARFESRLLTNERAILVLSSYGRLMAFNGLYGVDWTFDSREKSEDGVRSLYGNQIALDDTGTVYALVVLHKYQTVEPLIISLNGLTGEILAEDRLSDLLNISKECPPMDPFDDGAFGSIAVSGDWLVIEGSGLCVNGADDIAHPDRYLYGVSLLDKKLKWRWKSMVAGRHGASQLLSLPDGSFAGIYAGSAILGDFDYYLAGFRITPLGETIFDKELSKSNDMDILGVAGASLSDGSILLNTSIGVLALSSMGEMLWQKSINMDNDFRMAVDRDDTLLVTKFGFYIDHYAPNGDFLYSSGMGFDSNSDYLSNVSTAPISRPFRWITVGNSQAEEQFYFHEQTPYYGKPENLPATATCDSVKNGSAVVTLTTEPTQTENENWTLRRVKDDSTYSCPLKPDIGNPFDSWAANAWSDETLDTVWIGGYDALWRYDTSTREALCLKIGNVEVITGHINQGATTLAYVMDRQLFIGPADGSATTNHALPEDIGVILSLAIDADSIAIGGPKGLWVRALTTETWTKMESCCGAGLQVNQSGLFLDGGTLWAGAFGGVWRVDPVAATCTPQCLATEPYSIFEIYGRSPRGVWVAWQEDMSGGTRPSSIGNTVGECLDNGVWFPQLTTPNGEWILTGSKTTEGLLALKIKTKDLSPDPELPDCVSEVAIQTLPSPIGSSAPLTIPVGGACGFGTCCLPSNLGQKIVPTKNGYFASGLWMEALRKQSAP